MSAYINFKIPSPTQTPDVTDFARKLPESVFPEVPKGSGITMKFSSYQGEASRRLKFGKYVRAFRFLTTY